MAGDGTPAALPGGVIKDLTLLTRDLTMFAAASSYNLSEPTEKRRSVDDLARFFYEVSRALGPDLFIEAGAKDASSSRRARRRMDPKRIVAFEANPYTHKTYARKFSKNNIDRNIEYLHLALSDQPGQVTFNVNKSAEGKPVVDGRGSLLKHEYKPNGFIEVTVEATSLDTFFADHDYSSCAMWIDVEGALEGVLTGGASTLDKASIVIVEIEDRSMWGSGQWMREDVVSYLYDHGLVPVARDFQSRYQYNIVFIRQTVLDSAERVRWLLARHLSATGAGGSGRPKASGARPQNKGPAKAVPKAAGKASAKAPAPPAPTPLRRRIPEPIRTALHPAYKAVRAAAGR
jgi:FkbM family methyltransferase